MQNEWIHGPRLTREQAAVPAVTAYVRRGLFRAGAERAIGRSGRADHALALNSAAVERRECPSVARALCATARLIRMEFFKRWQRLP